MSFKILGSISSFKFTSNNKKKKKKVLLFGRPTAPVDAEMY